jgi:hypothetical protein
MLSTQWLAANDVARCPSNLAPAKHQLELLRGSCPTDLLRQNQNCGLVLTPTFVKVDHPLQCQSKNRIAQLKTV